MRHDYTNRQWKDLDGTKPKNRFKLRYVLILVVITVVIGIIVSTTVHHKKVSDTQTPTPQTKATANQPHYHTIQLIIPPEESQ